jgi:hypothetical protein
MVLVQGKQASKAEAITISQYYIDPNRIRRSDPD